MSIRHLLFAIGLSVLCVSANTAADESAIRKNLASQLPDLPPIDEVTPTPVKGLWEVRMGSEVIYSDEQGSFLFEGHIIDLRKQKNITQERIAKLTAFDFAKLPLQDAVVWMRGTGARKIVIFADPNCSYCKRFESELNSVKDVKVYTFLVPILGGDSPQKSRAIWCAKNQGQVWRNWMIDGMAPPEVTTECDISALERNVVLGEKHGVTATPMLVFEDSKRVHGVMSAEELENKFAALYREL